MTTSDWRERIESASVGVTASVVATCGLTVGIVLLLAIRSLQQTGFGHLDALARLGAVIVPSMTVFTVFKWLFDTLIIWIAVRITAQLSGDPFHVRFLEGYRNMLPITMLMVANSSLALLVAALTGFWLFLVAAWFIDLLIIRYFLEMDWYEVFLLNAVLGFFSCATGGLL